MVGNRLPLFVVLLGLLGSMHAFPDKERLNSDLRASPNSNNFSSAMKHLKKSEIPEISLKALEDWNSLLATEALKNDSVESNEIPDSKLEPRIIHGREALPGEFPWMVALHLRNRFICSAFLISPSLVMTAAHCVIIQNELQPATSFYGVVGDIDRNGSQRINFSDVNVHSEYGTGTEYDIAVFATTEKVLVGRNVSTVCLPRAGRPSHYQWAQAMGWGVFERNNNVPSPVLMTARLPVVPTQFCQIPYIILGGVRITERHICAGGAQSGICFGDSGGPLVASNESPPCAIGVASFVSLLGCAAPLVPAVYTATSSYINWLTEALGGNLTGICFV